LLPIPYCPPVLCSRCCCGGERWLLSAFASWLLAFPNPLLLLLLLLLLLRSTKTGLHGRDVWWPVRREAQGA